MHDSSLVLYFTSFNTAWLFTSKNEDHCQQTDYEQHKDLVLWPNPPNTHMKLGVWITRLCIQRSSLLRKTINKVDTKNHEFHLLKQITNMPCPQMFCYTIASNDSVCCSNEVFRTQSYTYILCVFLQMRVFSLLIYKTNKHLWSNSCIILYYTHQ